MILNIIPKPWRLTVLDAKVPDGPFKEIIRDDLPAEAYRITLTDREKTVEAGSQAGLIHARATLEQVRFQCGDVLPLLFVEDVPSVSYRSFMLDSCRHFIPFEELKKMIRMAWLFKFNHFHWHISDDQGWRIESETYPALHEQGAYREGDNFGGFGDKSVQGGYYTKEQVRELVDYAASLGIEITPEVDMPGHTSDILHCFPELGCRKEPVRVKTCQGVFKDVLCAGNEKTYAFAYNILDELCDLFPGEYFHIGGDEAPKDHWEACPACRARMKALGLKNMQELQGYFENCMVDYLAKKGRKAIVWNDAAYGRNLDSRAVIQQWVPDKKKCVKAHVKGGGAVINSIFKNSYCDYPYALNSLRAIYRLETESKAYACEEGNAIIGTECLVWTEFVRSAERLEEYAWPRFAASAEAGWCGSKKGKYTDFTNRLSALFGIFAEYGIHAMPSKDWTPGPFKRLMLLFEFAPNMLKPGKNERY